jgi:2-methylcitrate dehydratase PrpD
MGISTKAPEKTATLQPRPVTRELAEFAVSATYESIPADVIERIRTDALDSIAVGVLGHTHEWVRPATELWLELGGAPQARLWGRRGQRLPVPKAVLANSHAMNSFEFDDTYVWGGFGTHQGNNVVPAAVAIAEWLGGVSGKQFLLSLAIGHEIGVRVMKGFAKRRSGWNHTALCSTYGGAATAGRLLGLDVEQMTWALGSAGSYVGGTLTLPPRSDVKRMVNGRAAEGAVIAALLAKRGFSGIENQLEARTGGFYALHAEATDLDAAVAGLGDVFYSVNVHTKRFPMCTSIHAPLEAACQLVSQHKIRSQDIARIKVRTTSSAQSNTVGFPADTIASAQMSLAFGVAVALKTGNVSAVSVTQEALSDPEVVRLTEIVEPIKDTDLDEMWRGNLGSAGPGRVDVTLRDGRELRSELIPEASRMTAREIEDKARDIVGPVLGSAAADRLVRVFREIETLETVDPLLDVL